MSRTDKDRPYRVRAYQDGHVDHDHRYGECRVETREQALAPTWRRYGHYRKCKKYEEVVEPCKGALLIHARGAARSPWSDRVSNYRRDTCTDALTELAFMFETYVHGFTRTNSAYNEKATSRFFVRYAYGKRHYCSKPHVVRVRRADWPCTCDNDPIPAPCDYRLSSSQRHRYGTGSVPGWYCSLTYHRPQRRATRDMLESARRDWNANGCTEIEPENRQHRHEAGWSWW